MRKSCPVKFATPLFILLLLCMAGSLKAQHVTFYVKQNAAGANNGSSWANAFTTLIQAFITAQQGDTIRIAKGTYKAGNTVGTTLILKDSMVLLGGYPDIGNPTDADRNFSENLSILSGEIGTAVETDNSNTLLAANNKKGILVDGLVFEKAWSNPASPSSNGTIYINNSTARFRNNIVRNNLHLGALSTAFYAGANSLLRIENCFIINNGIADASYSIQANNSTVNLENVVIAKNSNSRLIQSFQSVIKLTNVTVFKNQAFSEFNQGSQLRVENSIFYNNGNNYVTDTSEFQKDGTSAIQVYNSITQVYNVGVTGFNAGNPLFIDTASITGADGKFFTADDGLRLTNPCSKGMNSGENNFVSTIPTDITGAFRIRNSIVDMGAYEVQEAIAPVPAVVYVKRGATGANNGSSWTNAFTDLQKAFASCSDSIKIAGGVYPVSAVDSMASFVLQDNRVVIGGYAGLNISEMPDPANNLTILDGMLLNGRRVQTIVLSNGNKATSKLFNVELRNASEKILLSGLFTDNAALKVGFESKAIFEGVTIASYHNYSPHLVKVTAFSMPLFKGCRFFNGNDDKGLRVLDSSHPRFVYSYFGKDTTAAYPNSLKGGGLWIERAKTTIDSSLLFKTGEPAVRAWFSDVSIASTDFIKINGGSIVQNGGNLIVKQCVFRDTMIVAQQRSGTTSHAGAGIASYTDCKFFDSYSYNEGPFSYLNGNSNVKFTRCFFSNGRRYFGRSSGFTVSASTLSLMNCVVSNPYQTLAIFRCENGSNLNIIGSTVIKAVPNIRVQRGPTNEMVYCTENSSLKLYNSLFWRYGDAFSYELLDNDIRTSDNNNIAICDIKNSHLFKQINTPMQNSSMGFDPKIADVTDPDGPDNIFGTPDDGFALCNCSSLLNTANNALDTSSLDAIRQPRTYGATNDKGAYELQQNTDSSKTFYVRASASSNGDGKSWATAYNNLQKAILNNCAETIKLTAGIYKPSLTSRDSMFNIYRGLHLSGGFPDVATPTDAERNPHLYPTILSGDIGVINDTSDNSKNIIWAHVADSVLTLDGLLIEKTNSITGGFSALHSDGTKKLNIFNCIFQDNYTTAFGGSINSNYTNLVVKNAVFRRNYAEWGGGINVIAAEENNPVPPPGYTCLIQNSIFAENSGRTQGGGISFRGGRSRIDNSIFYRNKSLMGAGIYSPNIILDINNCDFLENNHEFSRPGVAVFTWSDFYSNSMKTKCFNSVFRGNTVLGATSALPNTDFYWRNGDNDFYTVTPSVNAGYNFWSANHLSAAATNRTSSSNMFVAEQDPEGADNKWFTSDDGLRVSPCSPLLDTGLNSRVIDVPADILGNARIQGIKVDVGAYEGAGELQVQLSATDTVLCNAAPVTFTASTNIANNANSIYQWYKNNVAVGNNTATYTIDAPVNLDSVRVTVTNTVCAAATPISSVTIQLAVGICAIGWTGAVSNEWEHPQNWSTGQVPGPNNIVTIPAGVPHYPVLSSNATIYSITVATGASLTVSAGGHLQVLHP